MVVGSFSRSAEVAVVGGGPGGYLAAIRLAQLKKDVLLIEEGPSLGGICLNEGCIPSKALIHAADFLAESREAEKMGIALEIRGVDMARLVAWKDGIVKRLTQGVRFLAEKNGAEILRGHARFTSPRSLSVETEAGVREVTFQRAILATGSSPFPLPGFEVDGDSVIGSREALSLKALPSRMVVIGGGYIGLELGSVFRKLGVEVALVEFFPELLPQHDPEVREVLTRRLRDLGVELYLGHKALRLKGGSPVRVTVAGQDGVEKTLEAERVLVSVGRIPNVQGLGLEEAGVKTGPKGFITVNARMETSAPHILAVGDVVGGPLLAHKAYREAKVAAEVIAGEPSAFDNVVVPAVIYTDPEIAWAGLSEQEAVRKGHRVITGTFPFKASGRAMTLNATEGFVKTVADAETRRILGVHIVGQDASEMVSEAALAMEMGAFLDDLSQTIHPHPTLSEGLMESVEAALGAAVHILNK